VKKTLIVILALCAIAAGQEAERDAVPVDTVQAMVAQDTATRTVESAEATPVQQTDETGSDQEIENSEEAEQQALDEAPAQHVQESKPKRKAKPPVSPQKPGTWMSAGAGVFFANNVSGDKLWNRSERVEIPYFGSGAYLFFDAVYAEIFVGISSGGGKWEIADTPLGRYMERSYVNYVNIGGFLKAPIDIGALGGAGGIKVFPLIGYEYESSFYGKLNSEDGEYEFDGKNGHPSIDVLNALWLKFGGGVDLGSDENVYMRAELLYGLRTDNKNSDDVSYTRPSHRLTLKIGIGVKF
jgi:hypothetical protein